MVQAAGSRDQVAQELCALAQTHIDNWDNYAGNETTSQEYGFNFVSRQTEADGVTFTVAKASVPGLTHAQHQAFRSNLPVQLGKLDDKVSFTQLPDVEGRSCLLQQIKMPMMMSNRSVV